MEYTQAEILQTVAMTEMEHLDVRTVTLGLNLLDCTSDSITATAQKAGEKIRRVASRLVQTVDEIGDEFGIKVANKRISITPVSLLTEGTKGNPIELARAIDDAAEAVGVDFIGGYSALVQKGATPSEKRFLDSIPEVLSSTARLCSSVNAATTRAGINMDVVAHVGRILKDASERTRDRGGLACAKFVCFANAVEDNPFMAGAFHGISEAEAVINVGVSGPGVVNNAVRHADRSLPLQELAETIKNSRSNSRAPVNSSAAKLRAGSASRSASSISHSHRRPSPATQSQTSSRRWASSVRARTARPRRSRC